MIATTTIAAKAVITAILLVSAPGVQEQPRAAFFENSGPELCRMNAQALNDMAAGEGLDIYYRCDEGVRR